MPAGVADAVIPLAGVLLGGFLAFAAQLATGRLSDRAALRKERAAMVEGRRQERIELLERFLRAAGDVDRLVIDRHQGMPLSGDVVPRAVTAMDELWMLQKLVHILWGDAVNDKVFPYVQSLNDLLWHEPAGDDFWRRLNEPRGEFVTCVRDELSRYTSELDTLYARS